MKTYGMPALRAFNRQADALLRESDGLLHFLESLTPEDVGRMMKRSDRRNAGAA